MDTSAMMVSVEEMLPKGGQAAVKVGSGLQSPHLCPYFRYHNTQNERNEQSASWLRISASDLQSTNEFSQPGSCLSFLDPKGLGICYLPYCYFKYRQKPRICTSVQKKGHSKVRKQPLRREFDSNQKLLTCKPGLVPVDQIQLNNFTTVLEP